MDLILKRPKTKHRASVMFDFPEPFGPTTTLTCLSKGILVSLAKLLKPFIISFLMYVIFVINSSINYKRKGFFKCCLNGFFNIWLNFLDLRLFDKYSKFF